MKNNNKNVCLLLTATIRPNLPDGGGVLVDEKIRKKHYIDAVCFYLSQTPYNIVLCENSGNDLSEEIKGLVTTEQFSRAEIITFTETTATTQFGKNYSEIRLMEFAFEHSRLLNKSEYIVKLTGRLQCLNLQQIVKHALKQKYVEELLYINLNLKANYADARIFILSAQTYYTLFKKKVLMAANPSFYSLEVALSELARQHTKQQKVVPFIYPARIYGSSGGRGNIYRTDLFYFAFACTKQIIKFIVNSFRFRN